MSAKPIEVTKTKDTRSSRSASTDFSSLSGNEGKIDEQKYNPDPRYSGLFDSPNSSDCITWTTEAGCDFKIIQKATLEKCVQTMMTTEFNDGYFQECFVLAYRLVTTPERLLELLGILFDPTIPEGMLWENFVKDVISPLRLKIMNFVRIWIKNAWRDFEGQTELIEKLQQLLDHFEEFNPKMSKIIQKQIEMKRNYPNKQSSEEIDLPLFKPITLEKNVKFSGVLQFHYKEFARQISFQQNELFRKIPYNEFLGNGWMKKDKEVLTPNIMALVRSSQKLFGFVQNIILTEENVKMRAVLLHYFIHVSEEMKKLNNFEGMKAVLSALESSPIYRLKDTWDGILPEDKETELSLNKLCDQEKNFSKLREMMKIAVPPCLPFLGSTMSDLVFTTDGNKQGDKLLINWFKIRSIGNLVKEIMVKQAIGYPVKRYNEIMNFYNSYKIEEDQDKLYDISITLETKRGEINNELEKKIAKLKKEGNTKIKKYIKYLSK
ncbi:Ras guanine nucleotide exchange factor, putative [Entamoeba histolytica HM-1:IMSS-B]|uniref:Ras guanine nucleotide exchange factor, putative n=6 Tax=Entamoeba histolytica TaxID=5759 RepID=C4M6X0_ENTH1|nr:Ras guanine nucleotide exchange factor, putative [Entamoeba histolytica HM-1:IMSS]EMD49765.1 ras GTP exchange factor son of sevenless, putative [Entamoeba histolytica KU27]EMH75836.1 Ras guanine nucleotide exchange factor, putative [Entamoeba histolytica HM-1:IMSS-B]EMS14840.1 ras GTP exchange factor, son of sevenless, putative [Entamoeba histolytica HM-3:IMSS]ENY60439.1 ras GTP exchange factor, son of sevenless, putative [Entamoeba histolytica HM-1:IMSS-A]GAT97254.1 Ras guanine nucleotide |eukprot:XP_651306.1 Ras guanine nucleotide exchange factor, putative [Entamoeba histolytica HM-1:IMSS]